MPNYKLQITNGGQSLFELILAIGISALIIVGMVSLVNNSLQNSVFSKNQAEASQYAESATEWLRGQRDNNITTFITHATTPPLSWCLIDSSLTDTSWNTHNTCGSTTITGTIFIREVDFVHTVVSGKDVYTANLTVKWTDSKGTHTVNNSTAFTDWRER